ncbi:lamin tail domain-containing protein, partial [Roseiflexus sp.]
MRWLALGPIALALIVIMAIAPTCAAAAPTAIINEFMPAPASGPEWVEIVNSSDAPLDVGGWRIDDDTPGGPQTVIPPGVIVPPYGLFVITLSTHILNNTGSDAVTLIDAFGAVVDVAPYTAATVGKSFARIPDGSGIWVKGEPSPGEWNAPPGLAPSATPPDDTVSPEPSPTGEPSPTALPDTATPSGTPLTAQTVVGTPTSPTEPTVTHTPSPTDEPTETAEPTATRTSSPTRTPSPTDEPTKT